MKPFQASINSNREVFPGVYLLWLEAPEVTALPGQFFMVACREGTDPLLPRPFSLHRLTTDGFALLYRVVGKGTRWLARRQPGEAISLFGPLGRGFDLPPTPRRLLAVAGGMGIAPLVALAEEAAARGFPVLLIYGVPSSSQLLPSEHLPASLKRALTTEDGSAGVRGKATDILPQYLPWADQVYACGPEDMYRFMAGIKGMSGKPCQVLVERVMACGYGACLGCALKTREGLKLACTDGPCFKLGEIIF